MRIIIEMEGGAGPPAVSVQDRESTGTGAAALDGGQPPAHLLSALGMDAGTELVAQDPQPHREGGAGAGDAGSPPQWLVDVIEGSAGASPAG